MYGMIALYVCMLEKFIVFLDVKCTYQILFLCIGAVILNFTHKPMAKGAGHYAIAEVILGAAEINICTQ